MLRADAVSAETYDLVVVYLAWMRESHGVTLSEMREPLVLIFRRAEQGQGKN